MRARAYIFVALTAALTGSCGDDAKPRAGVLLTVQFNPELYTVNQFYIEGYVQGQRVDLISATIPETAGPPYTLSPVNVVVIVPDEWANRTVVLGVLAREGDVVVASGGTTVVPVSGQLKEATVVLKEGPPDCGNSLIEPGEQCDTGEFGGQDCLTAAGLQGGQLRCTAACQLDISGCYACGNGAIEGSEECDGREFGGKTCLSEGFTEGTLNCTADCLIDTSTCVGGCGNSILELGESCDGTDFADQTCLSAAGRAQGELKCTAGCHLDISGCHTCGDGAIEGPEECDSVNVGFESCQSVTGHTQGTLGCLNDCTFDTSNCSTCGDGQIQGGEECDDNNTAAGDGCSAGCAVEPGFVCQGEPSHCTVVCTNDSQCTYICDESTGVCVEDADILFVDCNSTCPGTGTAADPYCSLAAASAVAANGQFILVRPGVCVGALNINTVGINIVGETGAVLQGGTCPTLIIDGVTASVEGLIIRGPNPNSGGGVRVENGAGATLGSNTIGPGGCTGIDCVNSLCTVRGNLVAENAGGGIRLGDSDFYVVNNFIVKNGSSTGTWGGVSISGTGSKIFVNNTIADNVLDTGEGHKGGVDCLDPTNLVNCIIWQNDDNEVSSLCSVSYSDISQPGFAGTNGNINQNPVFIDTAANNYHISAPGSPCIDNGHPAGVPPAPAADFDGQSRPLGIGVDIGADEAG